MWRVLEAKGVAKVLDGAPLAVREKWDLWVAIVVASGPEGLRAVHGFHDEALSGTWKGHRASRLSDRYRIIYRAERGALEVLVVRVTAQHDYRRRR